ncbi:hypothetical protein SLUN_02560 [Streptomyces lunaelactis]|uniref:Uncharacterized protein n=1 Tax=Streptomyces lunaelactis TaxID=1535768 RepID=A0A2R4SWN1_9ACTN|nr:hypothetical protein [Streptomyces lunaelactis]AVZ71279.1 hypothetical protein SLUN_02560 [Streptomyces lunaelactis]NUK85859.1 hypothetical protein [Streptomyces lunaelactis]
MTVHPFIEAEKQSNHNVKRACELLNVSRTAFYARRIGSCGSGHSPLLPSADASSLGPTVSHTAASLPIAFPRRALV